MRSVASLVLTILLSAGCAGHSEYMARAPRETAALSPVADAATVVFVRESGVGSAINFTILDQDGDFLGESVAESHFAVQLPAGQYFFLAKAENADVVRASLAVGHLYFIHVEAKWGDAYSKVGLEAVRPGQATWRNIPAWIASTNRLVPLQKADQQAHPMGTTVGSWATSLWSALPVSEQEKRTLRPTDGVASATAPSTVPVGP